MGKDLISHKTAFSLNNLRHGWIDAYLSVGESAISLHASHTPNDALGDYLQAITAILPHPDSTSHCCWNIEPSWYYWTFTQRDPLLDITIRTIDRCHGNPDDVGFEKGEVVFSATCGLDTFAAKVCRAYQKLLDEYGAAEYQKQWNHPFPKASNDQLQAMIRVRKQSRR